MSEAQNAAPQPGADHTLAAQPADRIADAPPSSNRPSMGWLLAVGVLCLLLGMLLAKLVGTRGCGANCAVAAPPVAAASAPAPATQSSGKLIMADVCMLSSDGTAKLKEAQIAYRDAQESFRNRKISEKMLREYAERAKPRPADEVIASVPSSMLDDGMTCDDWRRQRAYDLVVGGVKPKPRL